MLLLMILAPAPQVFPALPDTPQPLEADILLHLVVQRALEDVQVALRPCPDEHGCDQFREPEGWSRPPLPGLRAMASLHDARFRRR
jgi:hypothetical protein